MHIRHCSSRPILSMWISKSPSSDSPYARGAGAAMPAATRAEECGSVRKTRARGEKRNAKSRKPIRPENIARVTTHAHSRIRPRARDTPHVNSRSPSGQFDGHRQHVPFLRLRSRSRPLRPQVRPPRTLSPLFPTRWPFSGRSPFEPLTAHPAHPSRRAGRTPRRRLRTGRTRSRRGACSTPSPRANPRGNHRPRPEAEETTRTAPGRAT